MDSFSHVGGEILAVDWRYMTSLYDLVYSQSSISRSVAKGEAQRKRVTKACEKLSKAQGLTGELDVYPINAISARRCIQSRRAIVHDTEQKRDLAESSLVHSISLVGL